MILHSSCVLTTPHVLVQNFLKQILFQKDLPDLLSKIAENVGRIKEHQMLNSGKFRFVSFAQCR